MIPYRLGFCPQCGNIMMGRNTDGTRFIDARKYCQIDLYFSDNNAMRSAICSDCVQIPDLSLLYAAIIAEGTQAADAAMINKIKQKGQPVQYAAVQSPGVFQGGLNGR